MKISNVEEKRAIRLAKKFIRKKPMPCSLKHEFKKQGLEYLLDDVGENKDLGNGRRMLRF